MNKFIITTAIAVLMVGAAVAGPGGKGQSNGGNHSTPSHPTASKPTTGNHHTTSNNFKSVSNYHLNFGKTFSHGFCYQGKSHSHWSFNCYWPKYGCQCYWCPSTCGYYYWCESACCYYPVSYITIAPPVQVVTVPVTVVIPAGFPVLPK
jgi:hypothetical protein